MTDEARRWEEQETGWVPGGAPVRRGGFLLTQVDRLLTWDGMILRKQRATIERYLSHPDARVREYANLVKDHNEQRRK